MPIPPVCPSCSACSITQINVCCFPSLLLRSPSKRARISSFMTKPALQFLLLFPPLPTPKVLLLAPLHQEVLGTLAALVVLAQQAPQVQQAPIMGLLQLTSVPTLAVQLPPAHSTAQARFPLQPTSTASLPAKRSAQLTPHANRKPNTVPVMPHH